MGNTSLFDSSQIIYPVNLNRKSSMKIMFKTDIHHKCEVSGGVFDVAKWSECSTLEGLQFETFLAPSVLVARMFSTCTRDTFC